MGGGGMGELVAWGGGLVAVGGVSGRGLVAGGLKSHVGKWQGWSV